MVNPFLTSKNYDTETAIMLEQAYTTDIGNAVAYTDGKRIFINTPDNLFKILPAYNDDMLKWLLWHERTHLELRHHNRFFKYVSELNDSDTEEEFKLTKSEVNIIMDILVHDWMSEHFPELVDTAKANLAQFRYRNSLGYTFTTFTLEEMLDEYAKHKRGDDKEDGDGKPDKSKEADGDDGVGTDAKSKDKKAEDEKDTEDTTDEEGDSPDTEPSEDKDESTGGSMKGERPEETEPKVNPDAPAPDIEHDETDWSKLEDLEDKEFITESEGDDIKEHIDHLKRKIQRLANITKTLNGLVTTTKTRSYKTPSYTMTGQHTIFKGQHKNKASLYLVFDASGSMGYEMDTFKDIIKNAVPQAMNTTTEWFSGYGEKVPNNPEGRNSDYYKSTFKEFLPVAAMDGYSDDGDRTIELCYKAEQMGYSPIGVTDGGGQISWSKDMLKQLKRTVFVGPSRGWLEKVNEINPSIQTLYVERY